MKPHMFSIITICLNDQPGLNSTHNSIKEQSFDDYEWIIIDGGSTDNSIDFLHKLHGHNITWISESDRGLYDAMNKGIDRASGEYLLFLNAGDDLASNQILENVARIAKSNNSPDMLYGDSYERTNNGHFLYKRGRSHKFLWYGMFTHHQAIFYKRATIGALRYRLEYPIGADYAFTAEILAKAKQAIYIPLAIYIFTQGGVSSRLVTQGVKDQWEIRQRLLDMSLPLRISIRLPHFMAHGFKRYLPVLYKKFRFSRTDCTALSPGWFSPIGLSRWICDAVYTRD